MSIIDDAGTQITDKGLMELVRRLEPFFLGRTRAGAGGIKVTDGVVTVDPTVEIDLPAPDPPSGLPEFTLADGGGGKAQIALHPYVWRANINNENAGTYGLVVVDSPIGAAEDLRLEDKGSGGILLKSWNGSGSPIGQILLEPDAFALNASNAGVITADATRVRLYSAHSVPDEMVELWIDHADGVTVSLDTGTTFTVLDSGNNPIFQVDEATGVTSGTFDGGGP